MLNKNNIERIADALSNARYCIEDHELDWVIENENFDNQEWANEFYRIAQHIVEPEMEPELADEYDQFLNEDQDNWVSFISEILGDKWKRIAEMIKKYGY